MGILMSKADVCERYLAEFIEQYLRAASFVIDRTQHIEDRMLLQGIDGRIMWSAMIDEANGDLTITAGGDKIGFVAFGACTSG